jgi:hypothetical protein
MPMAAWAAAEWAGWICKEGRTRAASSDGSHKARGLFARYLRTNVRTPENWEQGRARCWLFDADPHDLRCLKFVNRWSSVRIR